jgi:hypothetical protein
MRLLALLVSLSQMACGRSIPPTTWTCDFDASEPDAAADEAGALPASDCQDTCGPPVSNCTRTLLEGGVPAAVCPVCTF